LLSDLQGTSGGFDSRMVAGQAQNLAEAQRGGREGFQRQLAQRGLAGSGVGLLARSRLTGQESMQRASFLSSAEQLNQQRRMNLLQLSLGKSPTPTQAAPMGTKSSQKGPSLGYTVISNLSKMKPGPAPGSD
jgi:hypothetical protein